MLKRVGIFLLVACLVLFLAGCSCGGDRGTAPVDNGSTNNGGNGNNGGGGEQVQQEEKLSIEVINNSEDFSVGFVFASDSELDDWGEDHLGDLILYQGDRHTITLSKGTYDIKITDLDGYVLFTDWDVNSNKRIEIGGAGKVPLVVVNESDFEIAYMFISPSDSDSWGADWLASKEIIPATTGKRVFFVSPGTYDLKADDLSEELVAQEEAAQIDDYSTWTVSNIE